MTSSSQGDEEWQGRVGKGQNWAAFRLRQVPWGHLWHAVSSLGLSFFVYERRNLHWDVFSGSGGTFWIPHSRTENLELENVIFALFCCLPICKARNLPHPSTRLSFGTYMKFLQRPPVGFDGPASIPSFHNSTSIFLGETFLPCLVHVVWVGL